MQLRCPYPEARELPWFGRVVEPDEVVDIPDDLVENFVAAGWKRPDEPRVWPPEPPTPAEQAPPERDPAAPSAPAPTAPEPGAADEGQDKPAAPQTATTTSKKSR